MQDFVMKNHMEKWTGNWNELVFFLKDWFRGSLE